MMFYRGYIMTKDKKSIEKFKGVATLKTLEQVQSLPEFAGVMAEDSILVDIDDMEQSNLLLDICDKEGIRCKVLQSRSGMHFLFKSTKIKNCPNRTKLACGLTADIKAGFKSSYEVLKIDGKERTVLYDILEGEEYQDIPKWLFPIKCTTEFLDMDAGSGRNQALFNYILTLQSNDFSVEEARETIRIINQYILKEPLSNSELEVILRDDAFKKPVFFKGSNFLFDKFATYIKNNNHIIRINGQLHLFKDGVYVPGQEEIEAVMIKHISSLSNAKRSEVLKYLNLLLLENTEMAAPNMIAFRNGIYDLETDSLKPFSPDIVITNRIPWDYNPTAYSELADKTLDKIACHDAEIRTILEECIGSCFYRSNTLGGGKAFILTGEGSNGKSTFIAMIQHLLNEENITALDLKELDQKFQNAALFGKLANLGDDISDEFIVNASFFKKLVTGERVQVQNKGEKPFEFNNYAKFLFSANNIPRIKDKTGAVLRRLLIVPFDAEFSKNDPDYDSSIKYKLQEPEVMEYLIVLGIKALKNIIEKQGFTESARVQGQLKEYEETNNPIIGFFDEMQIEEFQIENEQSDKVYKRYKEYCLANNFNPMSKAEFSKQLCRKLGMTTKTKKIGGKVYRIYIKQ
ncbi:DNA primase family protein [Eubacterium sp. OM08-24]|uniref:DNA primase family protein n=1 Tax=Eubacterium sp. OM08-24 TaxID=2292352 RepID=UPI001FA928B3|nr:DNA primase family protein [Eubacterium sp. OM08-24]